MNYFYALMRCRWDFGDSLRFSPDPQIAFRPIWRTWNWWMPPLALWRTLKEPSRPKNVDSWHGRVDMMYVICFYICSYMYTLYIICILSFVRCFMFSESTREEEYFFDQSNFPGSCSWVSTVHWSCLKSTILTHFSLCPNILFWQRTQEPWDLERA